jgi:predicted MPP superfamily phosphohydrolase
MESVRILSFDLVMGISPGVFLTRAAAVVAMLWLVDAYAYGGFKKLVAGFSARTQKYLRYLYWSFLPMALTLFALTALSQGKLDGRQIAGVQHVLALLTVVFGAKLIFSIFLLPNDLYRLAVAVYRKCRPLFGKRDVIVANPEVWIDRNEFLTKTAFAVTSVPLIGGLHGVAFGKYNFKLHEHTLASSRVPPAFDGLKIVQLSDIHVGSFDSQRQVMRGIDMVRALEPDLILFTGDLVNNRPHEIEGWERIFELLQAPEGVYSVLGNHDYSLYAWNLGDAERDADFEHMLYNHRRLGWRLLRNSHVRLRRGDESIVVAGVENWGIPPFPQYGRLDLALEHTHADDFKILLSHDPTHWDHVVLKQPNPVDLTLSGHTHGMQFGVEIGNWRWSPVGWKYPHWAGMYEQNGHKLNVNRGFGFIGFPGRVGIFPEITLITLQRTEV